jgi:hypothetical protein
MLYMKGPASLGSGKKNVRGDVYRMTADGGGSTNLTSDLPTSDWALASPVGWR